MIGCDLLSVVMSMMRHSKFWVMEHMRKYQAAIPLTHGLVSRLDHIIYLCYQLHMRFKKFEQPHGADPPAQSQKSLPIIGMHILQAFVKTVYIFE